MERNSKKGEAKMRNKNVLLGDFEKVARAMAGRYDINVVASSACATDGRTIYFPANADDFNEATTEQLCGWMDHEVGHNREEDRHALAGKETPITIMNRLATSKERMFFNVFDDLRMEKREAQEHIGVAENIRTANDYCKAKIEREAAAGSPPEFWRSIGTAILDLATGGKAPWLKPAEKPFIDAIAEEIADSTDLSKMKWGEDVERLVKRTMKKLSDVADELEEEKKRREEEKKREEEENQDDVEGDDEGDGGTGDGDEGNEEEGDENGNEGDGEENEENGPGEGSDDEDGAQEDGEDGNGAAGDSEGDDDGEDAQAGSDDSESSEPNLNDPDSDDDESAGEGSDGDGEGEGSDEDEKADGSPKAGDGGKADNSDAESSDEAGEFSDLSDDDLSDAVDLADEMEKDAETDDLMDGLKDDLNEKADKNLRTSGKYGASKEAQQKDRWLDPGKDADIYDEAKKEVAPQIKGMKSKLINLIRAQAEDTMIGDRDSGELDDDALYSVKTGNRRVYTQTVNGTPLDTAVSILIDQSGSMGGERIKCAREMAVALSETFAALGVPFEVIGFDNGEAVEFSSPGHLRSQPFRFSLFKTFNENFRRVKTRLGRIRAGGDNADGEAVLEAAKRLVVRPETRKILFVLSDGSPACYTVNGIVIEKHLHEVIENVTAAGIEVVGIGCQYEGVRDYYNPEHGASCVVIHDISKLAVGVYKVMKEQLLGKGKKRTRKGAAA
jgi:cobalamin biosynthesis protein CobT